MTDLLEVKMAFENIKEWIGAFRNYGSSVRGWLNEGGNIGRENTQYQRAAQDMAAAGLHPSLLSGARPAPSVAKPGEGVARAAQVVALLKQKAEVSQTRAGALLTLMQAAKTGYDIVFQKKTMEDRITMIKQDMQKGISEVTIKAAEAWKSDVSGNYYQALSAYLDGKLSSSESKWISENPYYLDVFMMKLDAELSEHDKDILMKLPMPSGVLGSTMNMLSNVARGAWLR